MTPSRQKQDAITAAVRDLTTQVMAVSSAVKAQSESDYYAAREALVAAAQRLVDAILLPDDLGKPPPLSFALIAIGFLQFRIFRSPANQSYGPQE